MKSLIALSLIFAAPLAQANGKCLAQAKEQAVQYSAYNNKIDASQLVVDYSFYDSTTNGVLYYGVIVNADGFKEAFNVGLDEKTCALVEINYVTDGGL